MTSPFWSPPVYGPVIACLALAGSWLVILTFANTPGVILRALEFQQVHGNRLLPVLVYTFILLAGVVGPLISLSLAPCRVGVSSQGVWYATRLRTRLIPWAALEPSHGWDFGTWGAFGFRPSKEAAATALWVTVDQARAILRDPHAPVSRFPERYWLWVGSALPQEAGKAVAPVPKSLPPRFWMFYVGSGVWFLLFAGLWYEWFVASRQLGGTAPWVPVFLAVFGGCLIILGFWTHRLEEHGRVAVERHPAPRNS